MSYYAQYDTQAPQPTPVIAYYDTDAHDYPTMPDPKTMLSLTQSDWENVLMNSVDWNVDHGKLVQIKPPPTPDEVYYAKLAGGIAITSTGNASLNATYPLDSNSVALVGAVARDAASGLGLPGEAATVGVKDIDGAPHDFDQARLIALYKSERDLIQMLNRQHDVMIDGGTPQWPDQSATIP